MSNSSVTVKSASSKLDAIADRIDPKLASVLDVVSNTLDKALTDTAPSEQKDQAAVEVAASTTPQENPAMNNKFATLKQAHELKAQAYGMLEKAASMIEACGAEGCCAIGNPVTPQIVNPAAPAVSITTEGQPVAPASAQDAPVLVLTLAEKTAALARLERVAEELGKSEDEELKRMSTDITVIASEIDKQAKVIEDGFTDGGVVKDRLVDELEGSFKGGVIENGGQGGQGQAAINSFSTDKSSEVQNLPFLKKR